MAKPYREGKGWVVRVRKYGEDEYLRGFKTAAAAQKAANEFCVALEKAGKPARLGPHRTPLGVAFYDYARERLPFLKGAVQDARRINVYLRACKLPVIVLEKKPRPVVSKCYWTVSFRDESARDVPNSLVAHRQAQCQRSEKSKKIQARLARKSVADITAYDIQQFVDAMTEEGYEPASVHLERSELRRLFNYARNTWRWSEPAINPATGLKMPEIDNERDRVLTNDEWSRVIEALNSYSNPYVVPAFALLLETAMRSSEPLVNATWQDVDWERCILRLPDAKAGRRDVPLNPNALLILQQLAAKVPSDAPDAQILPITYEALKKAWKVACREAGVMDANIHDLRHTSATRYALEYNGNLPVLKVITGHKTTSQLMRYINIKSDDVVTMMHGRLLTDSNTPAGYVLHRDPNYQPVPRVATEVDEAQMAFAENVIVVDFSRRAA